MKNASGRPFVGLIPAEKQRNHRIVPAYRWHSSTCKVKENRTITSMVNLKRGEAHFSFITPILLNDIRKSLSRIAIAGVSTGIRRVFVNGATPLLGSLRAVAILMTPVRIMQRTGLGTG